VGRNLQKPSGSTLLVKKGNPEQEFNPVGQEGKPRAGCLGSYSGDFLKISKKEGIHL